MMNADTKERRSEAEEVEAIVSRVLRIGVLISAAVIVAGLILLLIAGNTGYPEGTYPVSPGAAVAGAAALKPAAVLQTGLMLLILTPVLRVAASLFIFLKERDYLYVVITLIVLVILAVSFLLGKAG